MEYNLPEGYTLEKIINGRCHIRYWVHQHFDAEFELILPVHLMEEFCRNIDFRRKTLREYGVAINFGWPENKTSAPNVDISRAIVPDNWE